MWIVVLALRRLYTFIVVGILIVLLGIFSIVRTPKDIFSDINIPVIAVIWNYSGLPAEEMEKHIISVTERGLTTIVNDIEHIESNCYNGIAVVKIYLQPNANVPIGLAQVAAVLQTAIKQLPPGPPPPLIPRFSASNLPVLRLGPSGENLSGKQPHDPSFDILPART